MSDSTWSDIYPQNGNIGGLLGIKETMEEAQALAKEYNDKGARTYIEDAILAKGSSSRVKAYAVLVHVDDLHIAMGF